MDLDDGTPTYIPTSQLVALIGERFFIADQQDDRLRTQEHNRLTRRAIVEVTHVYFAYIYAHKGADFDI